MCTEALALTRRTPGHYFVQPGKTLVVQPVSNVLENGDLDPALAKHLETYRKIAGVDQVWVYNKLGSCEILVECASLTPQYDYTLCNEGKTFDRLENALIIVPTLTGLLLIGTMFVPMAAGAEILPSLSFMPNLSVVFGLYTLGFLGVGIYIFSQNN